MTGTASPPLPVASGRMELAAARAALPGRVAVVMTMGALHAGHVALLRAARQRGDSVLVTIFVNPLQFGAAEDLDRYPRSLDADLAMCAREGVDLIFTPGEQVVYPRRPRIRLSAGSLGDVLEGASRPGHFDGVLTVVAKLLHLTRPDVALFGQKDAQQLELVRAMVADLDFDVEIVAVPTVREPDGLALSSRNRYLSSDERVRAGALYRALSAGAAAAGEGAAAVRARARAVLDAEPGLRTEYLALADPSTFAEVPDDFAGNALLAVAAFVGTTRLIDNVPVPLARTS